MRGYQILKGLGRTVAFYPRLARHVGGVNSCLFMCQLMYWSDKTENEIGVYKTAEEWTEETGLSYKEQATAHKKLRELGLITEVEKRLEHKIYYLLNSDVLNEILESPEFLSGSPRKSQRAVRGSTDQSSVHTEITTEITTEIIPAHSDREAERLNACREIWAFYSQAYFSRYHTAPVRNAKVNGQINQLLKRLGSEAAYVAEYFVGINDSFLIRSVHDFGLLLAKAEAYRTQWATNSQMNGVTAQQIERKQANIEAGTEAARRIMGRQERGQNEFL